jgi:hypothetical protein
MSEDKGGASASESKGTSDSSGQDPEIPAIKESIVGIRGLLQLTGTAIGTGATAVLAGLGYAQLHQIFPLPSSVNTLPYWILIGLISVGTLCSAFWLAAIFLKAQRRILLTAVPSESDVSGNGRVQRLIDMVDYHGMSELDLVEARFSQAASEENATRLRDLELRANRLLRMSIRPAIKPDDQASLSKESKRLLAMLELTLYRVAEEILERRSASAFKGGWTGVAFVCAAVGIVALFGIADYSKGQRDLVSLTKECASLPASSARLGWCQTLDVPATATSQVLSPPGASRNLTASIKQP